MHAIYPRIGVVEEVNKLCNSQLGAKNQEHNINRYG